MIYNLLMHIFCAVFIDCINMASQKRATLSFELEITGDMGEFIKQETTDATPLSNEEYNFEDRQQKNNSYVDPNDIVKDYYPENVELFVERTDQLDDPYEYPRNGKDSGLVVIFNHEKFEDMDLRKGSRRDVNELIQSFGRVGYNIDKRHIHNDLTRKQIMAQFKTLSELDYSDRNSLIIIFLTHGESNEKLYVRDGFITTTEVWQNFSNCPSLKRKPKMFVFQACKGKYYAASHGLDDLEEADESKQQNLNKIKTDDDINLMSENTFKVPLAPDMLIVYATVEGNVSYRHKLKGSWFIQELCRNINAYGRRDDVVSIVTRTTKCVANNYFLEESDVSGVQKQMPLFISTLTKKFYLTKSKDRNFLLYLLEKHVETAQTLTELQRKLDKLEQQESEKDRKVSTAKASQKM